MQTVALCKWQ